MRTPALALLVSALPSCSDRASGADDTSAPVTVTPTPGDSAMPECRARPRGQVLTEFTAGTCGAALVSDDGGLALWVLSRTAKEEPARGERPEPCTDKRPCMFLGYDSSLGPLVLAIVDGAASEMPEGVWLGLALDAPKEHLAFFDLWAGAGDTVTTEGTDLGPAHSLAPFACAGDLALLAVPRLPAASGVEAAAELLAREGVYEWDGTAVTRRDIHDRARCTALDVELP